MKHVILISLVACLLTGTASAAQYGLRGGLTVDPDQFHVGGHVDLGPVIESLRLVPNIEFGIGDNLTLVALNGDLLYDIPDTRWSVGGELGLNIFNYDNNFSGLDGARFDTTTTDIGMSAVGNYRVSLNTGKTLVLEAKLGLIDSPDFKFTVGWNF